MIKYTSHVEWAKAVTARNLKIVDETGYTEDLNASVHHVALDHDEQCFGHCIGGPEEEELDAILCDTADEYYAFIYEGDRS